MCAIMEELEDRAREEGKTEGEEKMSTLNLKLIAEKRYADLQKASTDAAYRQSLYAAYGIA